MLESAFQLVFADTFVIQKCVLLYHFASLLVPKVLVFNLFGPTVGLELPLKEEGSYEYRVQTEDEKTREEGRWPPPLDYAGDDRTRGESHGPQQSQNR